MLLIASGTDDATKPKCVFIKIFTLLVGIFTEKPFGKPMERNVVYYTSIITLSRATSCTLNDVKINHGFLY